MGNPGTETLVLPGGSDADIVADGDNVVMTGTVGSGGTSQIAVSRSSDAGQTWDTPTTPYFADNQDAADAFLAFFVRATPVVGMVITSEGADLAPPPPAVAGTRSSRVAGGTDADIGVAFSMDHGATWSAPVAVAADGTWFCTWTGGAGSFGDSDVLGATFRVSGPGDIIFVDFAHGGMESGTVDEPYNTLGEGLFAVNPQGVIKISPGSSPAEMPVIDQSVTLENAAGSGLVVVGGVSP